MLPDLRFIIGALIATVLLGVTLLGLAATMHISYQSKVGPLETSRMLAYTPEGRQRLFDIPAPRVDSPFANIAADPNPVPLRQQSPEPTAEPAVEPAAPPLQTAASVATALPPPAIAEPASLPPAADDADTVDERAVVDPPLPLDNDAPAQSAEPTPAAPSPEAAAANAPIETSPATTTPVVEAPAVPVAAPDVQQVGSLPPATTDAASETRRDVAANPEMRETPKRKAKRVRKTAKAKRPVRRATVAPAAQPALQNFPVGSTSNADRPAIGFWPFH